MAAHQIPVRDHVFVPPHDRGVLTPGETPNRPRKRLVSPFWRHFLQMLTAMVVGMIGAGALFLSIVGPLTWEAATTQYPTQALLAMAGGMTAAMVSWMLSWGMGWKNTYEMAAAMLLPVIPFLCLVGFGVTKSAACGAYCVVTVVAMLGLMFYRRAEYSKEM